MATTHAQSAATQTASKTPELVHRERLSRRYHDSDKHPWLAIAIGMVVVVGAVVAIALSL